MQRAALKRDPDKLREWKRKSAERQWEHQKKINGNHHDTPGFRRQKPLKKISKSQRKKQAKYYPIQRQFLDECHRKGTPCAICLVRDIRPANKPTEVHHLRGRAGSLITDIRGFVPSCWWCRLWPHENPIEARALGVLAPAHLWNVPFKDEIDGEK